MTTPLPMTHVAFSFRIPEGKRWNLYLMPLTTMVCPALDPPATRAQTSYSCKSIFNNDDDDDDDERGGGDGHDNGENVVRSKRERKVILYYYRSHFSLSLSLSPTTTK